MGRSGLHTKNGATAKAALFFMPYYSSFPSSSISFKSVAQLVAKRTTVCPSSSFSQKLNFTFSPSRYISPFSRMTKIWLVGVSIKKR